MTEAEFNACDDPQKMLRFLTESGCSSTRRVRLFSTACCRDVAPLLDKQAQATLDIIEDGDNNRIAIEENVAWWLADGLIYEDDDVQDAAWAVFAAANGNAFHAAELTAMASDRLDILQHQSNLVRDLFGPLAFRRISVEPAWLTPTVTALATTIYEQRSFDLMPALGAALSDAGCRDEEILRHCGTDKPHVRGCWVLDLLLSKS